MRLFILLLIIASTPFASTDLALASAESERTNAFEFDSVQRYLRANSTYEQEDEERKYTNEQIMTGFEHFLLGLPGFSYDSIKKFAELHFHMTELKALTLSRPPKNSNAFIMDSLFKNEFQEKLRTETSLRVEKYIDIALYLVLLQKVGGSVFNAAKEIDNRMKWGWEGASRIEDGQFLLWYYVLGAQRETRFSIFRGQHGTKWINNMMDRYQVFWANEEKRRMPGMAGISTSRF